MAVSGVAQHIDTTELWRCLFLEAKTASIRAVAAGRPSRAVLLTNLRILTEAESLDPTNVAAPLLRGSQQLLLRDPQAAIRAYREALALEPRAEVYNNLGQAYLQLGDEDAAAEHFEKAVQLDRHLRSQSETFLERRKRTARPNQE